MGTVARGRAGLRTLISPFKTRLGKEQWQRFHDEMRPAVKETSCSGYETARSSVKTETSYGEGKSCGLTSGGQNHIASSSWFRLSMMSLSDWSNPHCWDLADAPACSLCQRKETFEHVFRKCRKALGEDQVLQIIGETIRSAINSCQRAKFSQRTLSLIRA